MAKDKVGKGFFFYFGFFLLIVLAAVLVIFVVMMFMPGTNIMGLQYFTNSINKQITQTTDGKDINFSSGNFSSIEINAGYTQVVFQKNNDFQQNGIYLINNAKGFATSKTANPFSYSVTMDDNRALKINITEQNGFIYFSKDAKLIIQISDTSANPLANTSLIVKNNATVNIGGAVSTGYTHDVAVKNLDISSGSGDIILSPHAPKKLGSFKAQTSTGEIFVSHDELTANETSFVTESGKITATTLKSPLKLSSGKGTVHIDTIDGNVDAYGCRDVFMGIGKINGSLSFDKEEEEAKTVSTLSSSVIKIGQISGNVFASAARGSRIEFGTITGYANVVTSTGSIKIDLLSADFNISSTSGNIEVAIASGVRKESLVFTQKGKLTIKLPENCSNVKIQNETGETYLNMLKNAGYTIKFTYFNSEDVSQFKFDNVSLNMDVEIVNPLKIFGGGNELRLACNKKIIFSWRESA